MSVTQCFVACVIPGPPTEYLEYYIFPYLLPALEEMLKAAKKEKCFEVLKLIYASKFQVSFITDFTCKCLLTLY